MGTALRLWAALAAALLAAAPGPALGLDLWRTDDGLRGLELTPSLKVFAFGLAGTLDGPDGLDELWPVPEVGGGSLLRLRLRLVGDLHPRVRSLVHYEQRLRVLSSGRLLSSVSSALQGDELVPFRLHPLEWRIAASRPVPSPADPFLGEESPSFVWEHELDRLAFVFSLPGVDLTLGRQAVGWGLGRFFAPLDLFAPMSPTDLDREERRGVDAARLTLALSPTAFLEVVAVSGAERDEAGEPEVTWRASALAWLVRAEVRGVDLMLAAGKLGPDRVAGAAVSGQLLGVTLRAEATLTVLESGERFARATAGLELGTSFDLTAVVEYHYNGLSVLDPADYLSLATRHASRLASGQMTGLGPHHLAAALAWQPGPWGGLSLVYVQNLTDGSLVLGPSVDYVLSDEVRLSAVALVPVGARPSWTTGPDGLPALEPRSEHGLGAQMYVLQLRAAI